VSEERLQEIKDSVNFQREILKAHNMETLCIDEEQELIEEIEKLKEDLEYSNHCEQQMRKTITNLEYKITTLEEQLKEVKKSE